LVKNGTPKKKTKARTREKEGEPGGCDALLSLKKAKDQSKSITSWRLQGGRRGGPQQEKGDQKAYALSSSGSAKAHVWKAPHVRRTGNVGGPGIIKQKKIPTRKERGRGGSPKSRWRPGIYAGQARRTRRSGEKWFKNFFKKKTKLEQHGQKKFTKSSSFQKSRPKTPSGAFKRDGKWRNQPMNRKN